MDFFKEKNIYRNFILTIGFSFAIFLALIFTVVTMTTRELIYEQAISEARAIFKSVVLMRKWVAGYGGVYVMTKEGMEPAPTLKDPAIRTVDGKILTKKNPTPMTRELSVAAEKAGLFKFHITSLRLTDPDNKANQPDEFETAALKQFEQGSKEVHLDVVVDNKTFFRYMAPLYIEEACMKCHVTMGYKVGDVRGGISVTFEISEIQKLQKTNTWILTAVALLSILIMMQIIFFFTQRLKKKNIAVREQIEKMAVTDELTGLFNRRYILSRFNEDFDRCRRTGAPLGCIMADIDNFKHINDRHGHLFGDKVLREVAATITNSLRSYDFAGRFGGEEFLIVLPDTDIDETLQCAERMRLLIKEQASANTEIGATTKITISLGAAALHAQDLSVEDLVKRADSGLYKAKESGRDKSVAVSANAV